MHHSAFFHILTLKYFISNRNVLHLVSFYLLSTYYVTGTPLGARADVANERVWVLTLKELACFFPGKQKTM